MLAWSFGMGRRIDIELTSKRSDGTWTWRAPGAREPRGVVDGALLPDDATPGKVLRAEADFDLEGILVTSIIGQKSERMAGARVNASRSSGRRPSRAPSLSRSPHPRANDVAVASSTTVLRKNVVLLVATVPRGDPVPRGALVPTEAQVPTEAPVLRAPARGERTAQRRARRWSCLPGSAVRHVRDGKPALRGPVAHNQTRLEGPVRDLIVEARPIAAVETRDLKQSTEHRNAALATLRPEQLPVAEQLLRGGIPALRRAIDEQNARARCRRTHRGGARAPACNG